MQNKKTYLFTNSHEINQFSYKLTSILKNKGYIINKDDIINFLKSSNIKEIKLFKNDLDIDFFTIEFLQSGDIESIISYFLPPIYKYVPYKKIKELLFANLSILIWLRDNYKEKLDIYILKNSLSLDFIENELIKNNKIPEYLINNIKLYLYDIQKLSYGNIEIIREFHGFRQMIICRLFKYYLIDSEQIEYNNLIIKDLKYLTFSLKKYFNKKGYNIKHNELMDAIVITQGYKNYHNYLAEYNKTNQYKPNKENIYKLFNIGSPNQIIKAIINNISINKNNIRSIHLLKSIINILVHIRETENIPITFNNIIYLLNIENLNSIIIKYTSFIEWYPEKVYLSKEYFLKYVYYLHDENQQIYEDNFNKEHSFIKNNLINYFNTLIKNN